MEQDKFFENIFKEISKIVEFLRVNQNKAINPNISQSIEKRLERLVEGVKELKRVSDEVIQQSGIPQKLVDEGTHLAPWHLSKEERRDWERLQQFREELKQLEPIIVENAQKTKSIEDLIKEKGKKKTKGKRRMSKGTGFNKEWKKL